jgi:hypothetical protein
MRTAVLLLIFSPLVHAVILHGVVSDANTGEPIAGAQVILNSGLFNRAAEAISAADGSYSMSVESTGHYYAGVIKLGYRELQLANFVNTAGINVALNKPDQEMNFPLVKLCQISGRVTDASGKPIRSVRVVFINANRPQSVWPLPNPDVRGKPLDDGTYRLDPPVDT